MCPRASYDTGEEGKVTESMEALKEADRLKADKAAKEVCKWDYCMLTRHLLSMFTFEGSFLSLTISPSTPPLFSNRRRCNQPARHHRNNRNCESARSVVHICPYLIQIEGNCLLVFIPLLWLCTVLHE